MAGAPAITPVVTRTVFDNEGKLTPGLINAQAPPAQQALQLAQALERQGVPADQAALPALPTRETLGPTPARARPSYPAAHTIRIFCTGSIRARGARS
jgi:hypothetical protein